MCVSVMLKMNNGGGMFIFRELNRDFVSRRLELLEIRYFYHALTEWSRFKQQPKQDEVYA